MKDLITVRQFLRMDCFQGHKVLSGTSVLDNVVENVVPTEITDIAPYLEPHTVITTLGCNFQNNDAAFCEWVRELYRAGVSAVFVKTGRYIKDIPESVVALGNELPLPVVRLPDDSIPTRILSAFSDLQRRVDSMESQHFRDSSDFFLECLRYPAMDASEQNLFLIAADINHYILTEPFYLMAFGNRELQTAEQDRLLEQVLLKTRHLDPDAFGAKMPACSVLVFHPGAPGRSDRSRKVKSAAAVIDHLLAEYDIPLVVSRELNDPGALGTSFSSISSCIMILDSLDGLNPASPVYHQDSMVYLMLAQLLKDENLCRDYIETILNGPIRNETPLRQKEIRQLLRVYFRFGGSIKDIAAYTHTHKNTVSYRIQYIENVYNFSLKDSRNRWSLELALYLHDILKKRNR